MMHRFLCYEQPGKTKPVVVNTFILKQLTDNSYGENRISYLSNRILDDLVTQIGCFNSLDE